MQAKQTAVVLVDDVNDFLSTGGKLHDAVRPVLKNNQVVSNLNDLIRRARGKGILIIHVPIVFSPDYREMGAAPYGVFKLVKEVGAFHKGSWGAQVAEVLEQADSDIYIDNKSTTCAFAGTDLKGILDAHGIRSIALGGLLTNICIGSTMRTAYDEGLEVYGLTDCCATIGDREQQAAIEYDWPMFSKPVDHHTFIGAVT